MNILITGVNGFIGRHTIRALIPGYQVFGLIRTPNAAANAAVRYIHVDLIDADIEGYLPEGIDCVIHFAQSSRYRDFPDGAADMRAINIDATCKLLEWARKTRVKHFVFSSTANVYGKSNSLLNESAPTNPESFYGASKLAAEHLVKQYQQYFQVDILRLFTVYGPGQEGMLVPNIIDRIKTGRAITLAEGVGLYLTPVYVGDVVNIVARLIAAPSRTPLRLLNVCSNKVVHLGEIVKTLEGILDIKANIQFTDDEAQSFAGTSNLLLSSIGEIAFTELADGLNLTILGPTASH